MLQATLSCVLNNILSLSCSLREGQFSSYEDNQLRQIGTVVTY